MIIRITDKCSMGCSHCMNSSTEIGEHMSEDVFDLCVEFIKKTNPKVIIIGGGEPLENPAIFGYLDKLKKIDGIEMVVTSNGSFLKSNTVGYKLMSYPVQVQITNDREFYPKEILRDKLDDFVKNYKGRVSFSDKVERLASLGRAKDIIDYVNTTKRKSPMCFNIRSLIMNNGMSFKKAMETMEGVMFKFCSVSVNINGDVVLGESSECAVIGTVRSSDGELTEGAKKIKCNKCGLIDSLSEIHRRAINV